jgi:hypothetical protein
VSVTITCTKLTDKTVFAQAKAVAVVTWTLVVTPTGGGPPTTLPPSSTTPPPAGASPSATFSNVPDGTYLVLATTPSGMQDSQPVPFGTCS